MKITYIVVSATLLALAACAATTPGPQVMQTTQSVPRSQEMQVENLQPPVATPGPQVAQGMEWMQGMQGRQNMQGIEGDQPVPGSPAGYYPGFGMGVQDIKRDAYRQWYETNRSAINDILAKIQQIKTGQMRSGCVGRDTHTCVATLAQTLAVTDDYLVDVDSLYTPDKVDVNGNVLFEHAIFITGFLPGVRDPGMTTGVHLDIRLADNRTVKSVAAALPADPFMATTQDDYDKTGAEEVIAAMTRNACPNLGKAELARFIENRAKPKARFTGETTTYDPNDIMTANDKQTKNVKFCGLTLQFDSVYGNSTDLASLNNPHGAFGGMTITFQKAGPKR